MLASSTWFRDVLVRCVADTLISELLLLLGDGGERNVGIKVSSCVMFIYSLAHRL